MDEAPGRPACLRPQYDHVQPARLSLGCAGRRPPLTTCSLAHVRPFCRPYTCPPINCRQFPHRRVLWPPHEPGAGGAESAAAVAAAAAAPAPASATTPGDPQVQASPSQPELGSAAAASRPAPAPVPVETYSQLVEYLVQRAAAVATPGLGAGAGAGLGALTALLPLDGANVVVYCTAGPAGDMPWPPAAGGGAGDGSDGGAGQAPT